VLSVFTNLNVIQDENEVREEIHKSAGAYMKTICSFINPEAAKKVFAEDKVVSEAPTGPLPLSAFPKSVQEMAKKRKEEKEQMDIIVPGDLNIAEFPNA